MANQLYYAEGQERGQLQEVILEAMTVVNEGLLVQNSTGTVIVCNQRAGEILGVPASDLIGRSMRDPRWKFVDAEGETLAAEHTPVALAFGLGCPNEAVVGMYRFPGAVIWLQVNAIPLTEPGETHPHTVICTLIDITGCRLAQSTLDGYVSALSENTILQELQRQEVEQLRIRVKELEGRDGLTGLIGHGSFQRILAEAVLREAVSVILIGIDEFRSFNRQFGHEKGDAVLRQITEIIVGVLPDPECTCRYGGDRFAAVLPGATEPDGFGSGQRSRRNDPELQVAS